MSEWMNNRGNHWDIRKINPSYQKCSAKSKTIFHMKMEEILEKY
jgi:hypothetical protein